MRFPPGKKRGSSSRADNVQRVNHQRRAQLKDHEEDPDEEDEGACPGPAVEGDFARGEGYEWIFMHEF